MRGFPGAASVPHPAVFVKTIFASVVAPHAPGKTRSTVFAIKQVAHRLPSRLIGLRLGLALVGVHGPLAWGVGRFGSAAFRAPIGKSGLVRLEFELFFTNDADFDGKRHFPSILRRASSGLQQSPPLAVEAVRLPNSTSQPIAMTR